MQRAAIAGLYLVFSSVACSSANESAENAAATESALPTSGDTSEDGRCGWIPDGVYQTLVRCERGYGCKRETHDGQTSDVGHCVELPPAQLDDACEGISNAICGEGLVCSWVSHHPLPGQPGRCKPRTSTGPVRIECGPYYPGGPFRPPCPDGYACEFTAWGGVCVVRD